LSPGIYPGQRTGLRHNASPHPCSCISRQAP
jgi:hypothetical protein